MRVLVIGTGGVGEAIAIIAHRRDPQANWLERMVLSDYVCDRAKEVADRIGEPERFIPEPINARESAEIVALVQKHGVNLIVNACDPSFNETIFDTAYDCGCTYIDMALSPSKRHPEDPFDKTHIKLGDYQFAQNERWCEKGLLALVGSGVEPGMVDVLARYSEKYLFDEIEEIGIRDGNNLKVEGLDITFGFSIWTTIEECLNPPVIWEKERGWFTTDLFSEPEMFYLPEGIGNVEMVNVEHEEVILIPRYIRKGLRRVTFKFGLGEEFISALKSLQNLNLARADLKVRVGEARISPREFVAKVAPDPREIGPKMQGKTCAGIWVKGVKNGMERQVYLYQVADNRECIQRLGCQAVVAQTAFSPVIMMELLANGIWERVGVCGPEVFNPNPFVGLMDAYGFPGGLMEMESEYLNSLRKKTLLKPLE